MSQPIFDAETWIDTVAPSLGLNIDPGWRKEIVFHLGLVSCAAALVAEAPVEALECEPAPIFTPGQIA